MSVFEAGMLVCFGISWPISIIKSLRTKVVQGKSPIFMTVVALGYVSGMIHKIVYSFDQVFLLYVFNFVMVTIDLGLYWKYRKRSLS
ncbi:MAG: hypothetical protein HN383_10455 [Verrucomicrobia bacterium]|nr:hypothetical protein [Verrucomicrobiota bacterium]MBT7700504.1 hypothetical protein [Verrucomicrobiota bacterium]